MLAEKFNYKNPCIHIRRNKSRAACCKAAEAFFPNSKAEAEGDAAWSAVIVGKKAVSPGCVAVFKHLRAVDRQRVVHPRRKPQLARVFKPHVSRAAVGGNIAEASVCKDAAPDSRRQRAVYIKRKASVVGVLVPHRGRAASYSLCKTPRSIFKSAAGCILSDDERGGAFYKLGILGRQQAHPGVSADERFKPVRCKRVAHPGVHRPAILAALIGQENKICVNAAASEQTELLCYRYNVAVILAADYRKIARKAAAPEAALGRKLRLWADKPQALQHAHSIVNFTR